mmetsp:Transcript_23567/g.39998  ORF Transcript_23567/g.39998 Transcript_23567/m.39998 type:complete len:169 (-) Transcript_23567:752-1258(-)
MKIPASDALFKIEELGPKKFKVTLHDDWKHVLPQTEEDPGCLIMWDDNNLVQTVNAFNVAIAGGAVPPPAWLNAPIIVPYLKASILGRVQQQSGGGVIGNSLIAPSTIPQYAKVKTQLFSIGLEPLFVAHDVVPIGCHYILADNKVQTTAVADPVSSVPQRFVVGVFN